VSGLYGIQYRFGHSSGGIIGITLKPEALKVWALSRHMLPNPDEPQGNRRWRTQNVVLTGVENKMQLISIIFGELIRNRLFRVECTKGHKLVVTGEQPCPVEISSEVKTRHDLETHHEEADNSPSPVWGLGA